MKLVIMQGLPASGKSTKAQEYVKNGFVRVNKDLLRTMLHFDKWSGKNEEITFIAEKSLADLLLEYGKSVVVDDTNLNPKVIEAWKEVAKWSDSKIEYCKMDTSYEECVDRDLWREKPVGKSVILKMAMQYGLFPKPEKGIVVCDLDGTLCDIKHRLEYAKGESKNWDTFFSLVPWDTVRQSTLDTLIDLQKKGHPVLFVSARPERCREDTERWLSQNLPEYFEYIGLFMRPDGDSRDDVLVKGDIYEKYLRNYPIEVVIDDRPKVIRMWREKGLNVLDVGEGIEF